MMRSLMIIGGLILGCTLLNGCASTGSTSGVEDRTNGVRLTLQVERGTNSIVRYRVARDGALSYAGGAVARRDEWSWTGRMQDQEIQTMLALLEQHQWERGNLDRGGSTDGETVVYRLDLWTPRIRDRFRHIGESDRIAPMHDFLESVAARRHDEFMSTLPKPDIEERETDDGADDASSDG